jgi:hypothetical protein
MDIHFTAVISIDFIGVGLGLSTFSRLGVELGGGFFMQLADLVLCGLNPQASRVEGLRAHVVIVWLQIRLPLLLCDFSVEISLQLPAELVGEIFDVGIVSVASLQVLHMA